MALQQVAYRCKKANSSKNVRFWYEIIVKPPPEMEFLEKVVFSYSS